MSIAEPRHDPTHPKPSLLNHCPVVPVVVLDDIAQARPLGHALLAGGITIAEITLRTAAGLGSIAELADLDGLLVGAGSVVTPDQVDQVVDVGARFVVSPGLSASVVERCREHGIAVLPGIATASEVMQAVALGLTEVKFFPAGLLGGPAGITALAAPFPGIHFMPSGGVSSLNQDDYLSLPMVPAVSGSWMVDRALLHAGDYSAITARSSAAITAALRTTPGPSDDWWS